MSLLFIVSYLGYNATERIYSNSKTLGVGNCLFLRCNGSVGGGLCFVGSEITVTNSAFYECESTSSTGSASGSGGGIYACSPKIVIKMVCFCLCRSAGSGTAMIGEYDYKSGVFNASFITISEQRGVYHFYGHRSQSRFSNMNATRCSKISDRGFVIGAEMKPTVNQDMFMNVQMCDCMHVRGYSVGSTGDSSYANIINNTLASGIFSSYWGTTYVHNAVMINSGASPYSVPNSGSIKFTDCQSDTFSYTGIALMDSCETNSFDLDKRFCSPMSNEFTLAEEQNTLARIIVLMLMGLVLE